jgi:hypothetical protein
MIVIVASISNLIFLCLSYSYLFDMPVRSFDRQQPLVANPHQFLMGDHPFAGQAAAGGPLAGVDALQATPLADGELGLAEEVCNLGRRIPILHGALLDQQRDHRLQRLEAFGNRLDEGFGQHGGYQELRGK